MSCAIASFRDPAGRVVRWKGRVLRIVAPAGDGSLRRVLASAAMQRFLDDGSVVGTDRLDAAGAGRVLAAPEIAEAVGDAMGAAVYEHESGANDEVSTKYWEWK